MTAGTQSARLVPSRRCQMLAKFAVLAVKYKALIELVRTWWAKRKAKKNKG